MSVIQRQCERTVRSVWERGSECEIGNECERGRKVESSICLRENCLRENELR